MDKSKKELIESLKEIKCSIKTIEAYSNCDDIKTRINILRKEKYLLLDKLHNCQKKIDCIDYLIYKEEK